MRPELSSCIYCTSQDYFEEVPGSDGGVFEPLRGQVEDFVGGTPLSALPLLQMWVGGLKLVKVVERETEARHAANQIIFLVRGAIHIVFGFGLDSD